MGTAEQQQNEVRTKAVNVQEQKLKGFWTAYLNSFGTENQTKKMFTTSWRVDELVQRRVQKDGVHCGVWVMYVAYALMIPTRNFTRRDEVMSQIYQACLQISNKQTGIMGKLRAWIVMSILENQPMISNTLRTTKNCGICYDKVKPSYYLACRACGVVVCRHCYHSMNRYRNWGEYEANISPSGKCVGCQRWSDYVDDCSNHIILRKPIFGFVRTHNNGNSEAIRDFQEWNYQCSEHLTYDNCLSKVDGYLIEGTEKFNLYLLSDTCEKAKEAYESNEQMVYKILDKEDRILL